MALRTVGVALFSAALAAPAAAHYGMIIPSDSMVSQEDGRSVGLTLSFSHPFERDGMIMKTPAAFTVTHGGETTDLLGLLREATVMDEPGFTLDHALERPGAYIFAMEPQPYWEPDEDAFTYAPPADRLWGFAALNTADCTLAQDGEDKAVELGAVIRVHFEKWTGQ